jgi:hypothetical protein
MLAPAAGLRAGPAPLTLVSSGRRSDPFPNPAGVAVSWDQRVCQGCGTANAANRDACFSCGKSFVSDAVSTSITSLAGPRDSLVAGVIEGNYLVVPFIGRINTGFFSTENAGTVSRQLQSLINLHSQEGWEFQAKGLDVRRLDKLIADAVLQVQPA